MSLTDIPLPIAIVLGVLLLAVLAAGGVVLSLRRSLPRTRGTVRVRGPRDTVEIRRDVDAVPHVYARHRSDAHFGLGWVHAQDRLWQMEMQRRTGAGRLSEVLGWRMVPLDRFLRTLGLHHAAASAWDAFPAAARESVEAYVAGINAFLAAHRGSRLPPELRILRIRPEPWTPRDVLTCGKMMAWSLSGTYVADLLRHDLALALGPERAAELMPEPQGAPALFGFPAAAGAQAVPAVAEPGTGFLHTPGAGGEGIGSNQWVVDGSRSSTGSPVLASDPHLPTSIPSTWYVAHLSAPGLDVAGATLPGLPAVVVGRTRRLAWGVTSMTHDVQDLFLERLSEDGRSAEFRGEWEPVAVREEVVKVKRKPDVTVTVRTTRHGPLLTDAMNANDQAVPAERRPPPREPMAFRWTALDAGDTTLASLLALNEAADWEGFNAALEGYVAPVVAFNYADVDGNIGTLVPGRIPLRGGGDGGVPAEGWSGEQEWERWIPYGELPRVFNPAGHLIVSANTRVAPDDYPYYLGLESMEPHRKERIVEMLEARERLTPRDHEAIQADTVSLHARRLLPLVLPLVEPRDERRARALKLLAEWDCDMGRESAAAAIFAAWWLHLPAAILGSELEPRLFKGWELWVSYVDRFVRRALEAGGTRHAQAASEALDSALRMLEGRLGPRLEEWRWDRVHTAVFAHNPFHAVPALRRFFSRTVPTGGDWSSVNVGGSWATVKPFEQRYIAGYRQVVDLGDPDGGRFIQAIGQSGHFLSPHYDDYAADWQAARYRPMRMERSTVERATQAILRLEPSPADPHPTPRS